MTKKKVHLLYTKQIDGLFHIFMDFSIMGYGYFPIRFMFPMSLYVTVMNVYLSVLSEQFARYKLKIIVYELI